MTDLFAVMKCLAKSNLRKKGLLWLMVSESLVTVVNITAYLSSKETERWVPVVLLLPHTGPRDRATHIQARSFHFSSLSPESPSQTRLESRFHGDSRSCQVEHINHHRDLSGLWTS